MRVKLNETTGSFDDVRTHGWKSSTEYEPKALISAIRSSYMYL